jgi:hypothetical protein
MAFKLVDLIEVVSALDFPAAPVKVRITIAGLAYCQLSASTSSVNFLQHVKYHSLKLTILRRRRAGPAPANPWFGPKELKDSDNVTIKVDSPVNRISFEKIKQGYPDLKKIMNLRHRHGGTLDFNEAGLAHPRARISIDDCGFYTFALFPQPLYVVEEFTGARTIEEIGYIMSGEIESKHGNDKVRITSTKTSDVTKVLAGSNGGGDWVYDIILNNHCTRAGDCKTDAGTEPVTAVERTDFHYYYELFKDSGFIGERRYDLKKITRFSLPPPFKEELSTGDKFLKLDILSTDVAACNPIVTDPPSW